MPHKRRTGTRNVKEQMALLIRQRNYFETKANEYLAELNALKEKWEETIQLQQSMAEQQKHLEQMMQQYRDKEKDYHRIIEQLTNQLNNLEQQNHHMMKRHDLDNEVLRENARLKELLAICQEKEAEQKKYYERMMEQKELQLQKLETLQTDAEKTIDELRRQLNQLLEQKEQEYLETLKEKEQQMERFKEQQEKYEQLLNQKDQAISRYQAMVMEWKQNPLLDEEYEAKLKEKEEQLLECRQLIHQKDELIAQYEATEKQYKHTVEQLNQKIQHLQEKEEKYKKAIHDYQEKEMKYKKFIEQHRISEIREPAVANSVNGMTYGNYTSYLKPYQNVQPVPFNPFKNS